MRSEVGLMKITKNGVVSCNNISSYIMNIYDTEYYTEPDNTVWIRICHHGNPANGLFDKSDSFIHPLYHDANRWFNASLCNFVDKYELMIKQKSTAVPREQKYRWIQLVNPMIATFEDTTVDKVKINADHEYRSDNDTIHSKYGGLFRSNADGTYLCVNNGQAHNWFGAIGCYKAFNSGLPGIDNTTIITGYIDLYLRIDNITLNTANMNIYSIGIDNGDFIEI